MDFDLEVFACFEESCVGSVGYDPIRIKLAYPNSSKRESEHTSPAR